MNLSDYFKYSLFANLSFIAWGKKAIIGTQSDPIPRIKGAVEGSRVPENLATQIFDDGQWYIPTANGFVPNDDWGFAANVFVKGNTNEKVLAIRGTEPNFTLFPPSLGADLQGADSEILSYGLALHPAVSLINYMRRRRVRYRPLVWGINCFVKMIDHTVLRCYSQSDSGKWCDA